MTDDKDTPDSVTQPVSDTELEGIAQQAQAAPEQTPETSTAAFEMEIEGFLSAVEAILFAADRPVSNTRIREAFGEPAPSDAQLEEAIGIIQARYSAPDRGFELRGPRGGYHFVTKMDNAQYIRRFQASKPFRLGRSALEVMAIVAYRQPITRAEIDQIRGIDSSHLLRTLIERGLVRMAGKADIPGRPVQYGTTQKFLETVGLGNALELPPLSELTQLQGDTEDPQQRMERGLDAFLEPMQGSAGAGEHSVVDSEVDDPMLSEIDALIQTAEQAPKEVYASEVHREVAAANREALEAFQAQNRKRPRKAADSPIKSVTYEELTH